MTREEGKTLPEAKGEVRRSINIFRYFAGEGSRMPGMLVPSRARPRAHVRHPQTDRRGGADHAVEFPERDSRLEAGARADLRQHRGRQARVGGAAQRLAHRGGAARGGRSEGRGQLRGRLGRRTRPGAGGCQAAQGRLFHRILRDRQLAARRGIQAPAAHPARNGRQESHHRAGRRRFQLRRRKRGERRVLFHRPEVHRHQPRHRGRRDLRPLRRRRGGAHEAS